MKLFAQRFSRGKFGAYRIALWMDEIFLCENLVRLHVYIYKKIKLEPILGSKFKFNFINGQEREKIFSFYREIFSICAHLMPAILVATHKRYRITQYSHVADSPLVRIRQV